MVSAATIISIPLTPSSVYLLLRTSIHSVGKITLLPSEGTLKTSGFSTNKDGSTALTSSVSGHGVTRSTIPHLSALKTTKTDHPVTMDSGASESYLVFHNTPHVFPSRLTTSTELKELERTATTRVTISLKFHDSQIKSVHQTSLFPQMRPSNPGAEISKMPNTSMRLHRTLGLIILTSLSQLSSSPTFPSQQISVTTDQPIETDKMTFSSLLLYITSGRQTSLSQLSSPLNASSSPPNVPTLISASTVVLPCTTYEEIITKPTETKEKVTPSINRQRQTFLSISNLQTMASTLMSSSSVELPRCATNEEVSALPTIQPDETSAIPGMMVQFQPVKGNQELVSTQRTTS